MTNETLLILRALELIGEGKPLPDDPYDLLDDPLEKFNARLSDALRDVLPDPRSRHDVEGSESLPGVGSRDTRRGN